MIVSSNSFKNIFGSFYQTRWTSLWKRRRNGRSVVARQNQSGSNSASIVPKKNYHVTLSLGCVWVLFGGCLGFVEGLSLFHLGIVFATTVLMNLYFQGLPRVGFHVRFKFWGLGFRVSCVLETNLVSHLAIPPTSQNASNTDPEQSKRTSPGSTPVLAVRLYHIYKIYKRVWKSNSKIRMVNFNLFLCFLWGYWFSSSPSTLRKSCTLRVKGLVFMTSARLLVWTKMIGPRTKKKLVHVCI